MAGKFQTAFYKTDQTVGSTIIVAYIKVQPETLAATFGGDPNSGMTAADRNVNFSIRSSTGATSVGIRPRFVTLQISDVAADVPTGYKPSGILRIPILDPDLFGLISRGDTAVYLGKNMIVSAKTPERAK